MGKRARRLKRSLRSAWRRQLTWKTGSFRTLVTDVSSSFTTAWDPAVGKDFSALFCSEQEITIGHADEHLFPLGVIGRFNETSVKFKGYLSKFETSDMEEEEQPEATITITPLWEKEVKPEGA